MLKNEGSAPGSEAPPDDEPVEKYNNSDDENQERSADPTKIPISITVLTSLRKCTKSISRDPDGNVIKDSSGCYFAVGTGEVHNIDFHELPALTQSLNTSQVYVQGVPKKDVPKVFNVFSERRFKKKFKNSTPKDAVTRTKKDFDFHNSRPFVQMKDYDPHPTREPLSWEKRQQAIDELTGGYWANVAKMVCGSASSLIYDETGAVVTGEGAGDHTYFPVVPGANMQRYKDILMKRSCINGYGYFKLADNGAMLLRSDLFDAAVLNSPERIDFPAGAVIPEGWTQKRPDPVFHKGGIFNPALIPDLTPEELEKFDAWNAAAREAILPEARKTAEKCAKKRAPAMAKKTGKSLETCEKILLAACNVEKVYSDLYGDILLHFDDDDLGVVSVDEVKKNLPKYDGATLSDPMSDSGRRCTARLYANPETGKPVINGMEHGESCYFLHAGEPTKTSDELHDDFLGWIDENKDNPKVLLSQWLELKIKKIHRDIDDSYLQLCIVALSEATGTTRQALKRDLKNAVAKWKNERFRKKNKEINRAVKEIKLPFCFWEVESTDEGICLIIKNEAMYWFFQDEGFSNTEAYGDKRLIRVKNNVCVEADVGDVRNFLINEAINRLPLDIAPGYTRYQLQAELREDVAKHVTEPKIETLKRVQFNKHRDTKDATHFYFKNGFVSVVANVGVCFSDYQNLRQTGEFIWEESINAHTIDTSDTAPSVFEQFCKNVCSHEVVSPDKKSHSITLDIPRFKALKTVIGYLLTRYNDPSYSVAIILTDGQISDTPEGGTGKTIIAKAISKMRNQAFFDGKNHKPNQDTFAFQNMSVATESLLLDDVKYEFDFESYFSKITDGHEFEQKYKTKIRFPQKDNPKTIVTTNYAIKGSGNSHDRRKYEFEVYPYYNGSHTPTDDFGILFDDWDSHQWNAFYKFMFSCVEVFYNAGSRILPYHSSTLEYKKLRMAVGGILIDYADEIPRCEPVNFQDCFNAYKCLFSDSMAANISSKSFSLKLQKYCAYKKLRYTYDKNKRTLTIQPEFDDDVYF